jgi:hypothetical protein
MKKFALIAAASSFALALSACGDADDASEDAMADNGRDARRHGDGDRARPGQRCGRRRRPRSDQDGRSGRRADRRAGGDDAEAAVADVEAAAGCPETPAN